MKPNNNDKNYQLHDEAIFVIFKTNHSNFPDYKARQHLLICVHMIPFLVNTELVQTTNLVEKEKRVKVNGDRR